MMNQQEFLKTNKKFSQINSNSDQIYKKSQLVLKNLQEACNNLENGTMSFSYGGRPVRALKTDLVRVVSEWAQNDLEDLTIRNIILNTIVSLETNAAYSGITFLKCIEDDVVKSYRKRAEMSDVSFLVKKHLGTGICSQIVESVFKCSPNSSIDFTLVEEGRSFTLVKSNSLLSSGHIPELFDEKIKSIKDVWPIVIDGYIERVSEIHRLLETSSENNQKILIVARDFSPDVITTLHQNFKTSKLHVIPFISNNMAYTKECLSKDNVLIVDRENGIQTNTISSEDLKCSKTVVFDKRGVNFVGAKSIDRHVTIQIPSHFHKVAGLIEDRVKSGLSYCQDIAKYGIALDSRGCPVWGLKQHRNAIRSLKTFESFFSKIGCIVVVGP